jgi:predicted GNAT superfamily acetyltransferase
VITVRSCQNPEELQACVDLQIEVWGYDESESIPRKSFLVTQKVGGQVMGAFDSSGAGPAHRNLIGFAMSLPGVKVTSSGPKSYLHSHMLGVRDRFRNQGIGRQLKLAQRDEALQRGIHLMEWSFDPLEIKNAYLNIHRLGVVVNRYFPDFYGLSSSRLQAGLPTDRLIAEWWMDSHRVANILSQSRSPQCKGFPVSVQVPFEIAEWKRSARDKALAVQQSVREQLQHHFAAGLSILGFELDHHGNGTYQLGLWQSSPNY